MSRFDVTLGGRARGEPISFTFVADGLSKAQVRRVVTDPEVRRRASAAGLKDLHVIKVKKHRELSA